MSDDKNKVGSPDSKTINIHEPYEVTYWCEKFGCTKQQLLDAVAAVGKSVDAVRRHLGK
jgi:hypothetical protein